MSPLVVENVVKHYRQGDRLVRALDRACLTVEPGQFVAIMGTSGSGKSTLLHLMAGLTNADEGKIVIDGTDIAKLRDRALTRFRRRQIGIVFQAFNLIPTLTAEENVALPLLLEGKSIAQIRPRVTELLNVLGLEKRRTHRPDALSGGEQQRIAIGRALVTDPAVILADEPTGNLDSTNSHGVCQLLRDLSLTHRKTVVMVTHEPSVAAYACEVAVLREGDVVKRFAVDPDDDGQALSIRYRECLRPTPSQPESRNDA
jgi:putative ABC transport system ATP-binding protein